MRKIMLWIAAILFVFVGTIGCRRNTASPATPSASPAPTAASTDTAAASPDMPEAGATDAPVRDASYREYLVLLPSRGVQVHATVVLPGGTTVADAPASSAAPSTSPDASMMPEASTSPEASMMPEPSASPDASMMPEPSTSPDASMMPEPSAESDRQSEGGYPLVVFLHGHGGEKNENGGFTEIAHRLAAYGIASLRLDFAGSGESEESFAANSITSMKTDVMAAIDFAQNTYPIDRERIGVFGFDMGGRVALQVMADRLFDFDAAVLLAPANRNEDWITLFGGQSEWDRYKADAELNNYTTFTTLRGQTQDISIQWFSDLEMSDDPASMIEQPMGERVLIIWAENDTTVSPETSRRAAETLGARTLTLETGGHSYGFYAANDELLQKIADETARFFAESFAIQQ